MTLKIKIVLITTITVLIVVLASLASYFTFALNAKQLTLVNKNSTTTVNEPILPVASGIATNVSSPTGNSKDRWVVFPFADYKVSLHFNNLTDSSFFSSCFGKNSTGDGDNWCWNGNGNRFSVSSGGSSAEEVSIKTIDDIRKMTEPVYAKKAIYAKNETNYFTKLCYGPSDGIYSGVEFINKSFNGFKFEFIDCIFDNNNPATKSRTIDERRSCLYPIIGTNKYVYFGNAMANYDELVDSCASLENAGLQEIKIEPTK